MAATGAAISGQTVEAKCSSGTGTATSNADGSYTVSVTGGVLPCVLKITPATGPALYSVATGSGSSATANISPVTQLVVASLTGGDPAAYFTGFDATAAAGVTDADVTAAVTAVKTTLLAAGVDLGTIDVLAGTLTPGDRHDRRQRLRPGARRARGQARHGRHHAGDADDHGGRELAGRRRPRRRRPRPASPPSLPTCCSSPPRAIARRCAAAAIGWCFRPRAPPLAEQTGVITVDAQTLAVTYTEGSPGTLTAAEDACHFTDDGGKTDLFVTQAGVIVVRYTNDDGGSYGVGVGLPVQSHSVASLAGTWNAIGLMDSESGRRPHRGHGNVRGGRHGRAHRRGLVPERRDLGSDRRRLRDGHERLGHAEGERRKADSTSSTPTAPPRAEGSSPIGPATAT